MNPTFVLHRVNKLADLDRISDRKWGCEIDLRSCVSKPGEMHLSHDPWVRGDNFDLWLKKFKELQVSGPLILNTKEDGLEATIIEKLTAAEISNYFFLDTALPTLIRYTQKSQLTKFACRYSIYEPISSIEALKVKPEWIWVDCFEAKPMDVEKIKVLKTLGKICIVSPELQGGTKNDISAFRNWVKEADAVCTKFPDEWSRHL